MDNIKAEVVSVTPGKIIISVDELDGLAADGEHLKVGSYLKVFDSQNCVLIAIIESFSIQAGNLAGVGTRKYIIEATPLGLLENGRFTRGGDSIAIPPKKVTSASIEDIKKIFETGLNEKSKFSIGKLATNESVVIPVDGNKFFNKHLAVVGATGSGKSHTIARLIRNALNTKSTEFSGINNSHIVLFDIHSEYSAAFKEANVISVNNLKLPCWLLNGDELEELFLDSGDNNNYNQSSIFREIITANKKKHNLSSGRISFDSPCKFNIKEVLNCLKNLQSETLNSKSVDRCMIVGLCGEYKDGDATEATSGFIFEDDEQKYKKYFEKEFKFHTPKNSNVTKGSYADKTLDKFIARLDSKIRMDRLDFLFKNENLDLKFDEVLRTLFGYTQKKKTNLTILDLSGIPFEVLSITVSLISRLAFEYGYYYKRIQALRGKNQDNPLLLIYEEAHKYVPKTDLAKFRSSKVAIERIAKEGRKYGVSLVLSSQRPHEISETIFSQCSNYIVMRLTNPDDQSYIKKLLPDTMGRLINSLPSLQTGEALIVGDAIVIPSLVKVDPLADNESPASHDIKYLEEWSKEWMDIDFDSLKNEWQK